MSDGLEQSLRSDLSHALHHAVHQAVHGAIAKLAAEANAFPHIEHENQLRACIALARLAPFLLKADLGDHDDALTLPPDLTPERANELLANLEYARVHGKNDSQREESHV